MNVALGLGALLVAGWPLALSTFGKEDVYAFMGPYAVLVIVVTLVLRGHEPHPARARGARLRDVGIGLALGATMTLGTYGAYAGCERVMPGLSTHVERLYASARTERVGIALAWTLVIVVAEELLWRGALLRTLERRFGRVVAVLVSLGSYALAQSGSRSGVVVLAAVLCGAIWTATRVVTGSIVAPLVSHAIWTATVIHVLPVTRV